MSEEKAIAGLRDFYETLNRGDFEGLRGMVRPDIEVIRPGGQSPVKGIDAARAWLEPDAIEEQRAEPRDFRVNGNRVLVRQHTAIRGAGSGIELEIDNCTVWTLDDDGLVARVQFFLPHQEAEALEAAGLSA
jgi:ketosteroid isomerase-like protein